MSEKIYDDGQISIEIDEGEYFIIYDAGAHQIEIRRDLISKSDAESIIEDDKKIDGILFRIQKDLLSKKINPYHSNI